MSDKSKIVETPLMKQYFKIKGEHPDALLLFRVGDFYETFGEDAITVSRVLGIVLTKRANGSAMFVELAGFPHHALDTYLPRLVRAGFKVAVCDQLEDPKLTKKIVKRGITELVTPGIAYNEQLLNQKENNYLAAIYFSGNKGGIAFLDISTGTFKIAQGDLSYIEILLANFSPKEVVLQRGFQAGFKEKYGDDYYISLMDEWAFVYDSANEKLKRQFNIPSLKGFGVDNLPLGITAAGAILYYLEQNYNKGISHICSISRIDRDSFVWMDKFTFRNLEIFAPAQGEGGVSLLNVIDKTSSPLGARLLRNWLSMPLIDIEKIRDRHNGVEFFVNSDDVRSGIAEHLSNLGDLERIISRGAAGKILPREVVQLMRGLEQVAPIKNILISKEDGTIKRLAEEIILFDDLYSFIYERMLQNPANAFGKGDIIASGVDSNLDNLRELARNGKDYLLHIQQREMESTGISSLKIGYNNVFGYYLEVRNTHKDKVPGEWIRKQTLVNAERYITQELKEYEEKILGAEDKIIEIEQRIYLEVVDAIQREIPRIQQCCKVLAILDCLVGFATLARENNYCKPQVDDGLIIDIKKGRHAVIEQLMGVGEEYVANDIMLDSNGEQIIILTGPNMAGKSALLRQTALIVLMGQIGSFVPAERARIGLVDKIFTRVGASDNISRGESTFMVEMIETSTILHNISKRSLVLLDEIGRGTSTFDGMSIAWAIVEFLHEKGMGAKTLFATHYHELNQLEEKFNRVKNYHIAVKEVDNKVVFLRELRVGGVAHSFGIHVAKMAGMPLSVVNSAQRMLKKLESKGDGKVSLADDNKDIQLSFFNLEDPLLTDLRDTIKEIDINNITPLDAFDAIRKLKNKIGLN